MANCETYEQDVEVHDTDQDKRNGSHRMNAKLQERG